MRRLAALALLGLLVAACTYRDPQTYKGPWPPIPSRLTADRSIRQASFTWVAPQGQWNVDARDGHEDLELVLTNQGWATAEVTRLGLATGFDLSSLERFLAAAFPAETTPARKTQLLTEFVCRWMKAGTRQPFPPELYDDPLRALTVAGQGFSDDLARVLGALLEAAGVSARLFPLTDYAGVVAQWDGAWHLADPSFGIVFAGADGRPATMRQLAIMPGLVEQSLRRSLRQKDVADAATAYRAAIVFDDESSFKPVHTRPPSPRPWRLPAGSSMRLVLGGMGPREGQWFWERADRHLDSQDLGGWRMEGQQLVCTGASQPAILRIPIDLPFPITGVRVYLGCVASSRTPARMEIFVCQPQEGSSGQTRVFGGPAQDRLVAGRTFAAPVDGPVMVEIHGFPTGLALSGLWLEATFLHAPAAAPPVAGERRAFVAEAQPAGAQFVVRHSWR